MNIHLTIAPPPSLRLRILQGPIGPAGPQGIQGPQGNPGSGVNDGDKGDITVSSSGAVWTIDSDAVTYDKLQNISATSRFLGRITGGAGNAEELTGTQATSLLVNVVGDSGSGGTKGLVPAPAAGDAAAGKFLKADGTWIAPVAVVGDGDKGDVVVSGSGAIWTIDSGVVTLAKLANMNTNRLIGRDTAASGVPEELTVGGGIEFTGSLGIQTSAFTGDVTKAAGGTALTIANDAVTYAKLQNVSVTARFIGRITAGAGDAEELTGTQATTLLDNFTSALKGLAPASGGGTTNFLRADGTWAAPSAVVADGDKGDITVSASGATWTVDNDAISYAKIQNISATSRLLGRKTAAAGDTEECTLSEALDFVGSAAQGDILYRGAATWTRLGAGTTGQFLKTLGAGANPAWDTVSGTAAPSPPQGRLTLTTVTPILTANVAGATTIYYTPYVGRHVPLYDGSSFTMTDTAGELSQATTDSTKSPAACTTNSNYDLFVWNDGGTIRCTRGPAWTSDTGRGTGAGTTELTLVNSFYLNAVSITNGPAASRGTYVGTIRTNGSSQVDFHFGAAGVGGVAAIFGLWNLYNRVPVRALPQNSTASWTYNSTTPRQPNGSTTYRVYMIRGLDIDQVGMIYHCGGSGGASGDYCVGVSFDGSTTPVGQVGYGSFGTNSSVQQAMGNGFPGLGWHYANPLEFQITTASTATYLGTVTYIVNGFRVETMH